MYRKAEGQRLQKLKKTGRQRFLAVLALTSIILSGCSAYDREYVVVTDYSLPAGNEPLSGNSVQVSDIQQLRETIRLFVSQGKGENGLHRVVFSSGYTGVPAEDMAAAIWQVRTEDALCAYCVENISYELRQIVSSVEADISVAYSAGAIPVEEIITMPYATGLNDVIASSISEGQERLAVLISRSTLTEDSMAANISELYLRHPGLAPSQPTCTVAVFSGSGTERLYELSFQYQMSKDQFRRRKEKMDAILPEVSEDADDFTRVSAAAEMLYNACDSRGDNSIYAALVVRRASSEGIALGFTELCRRLGLECYVVNGQKNREDHSWNIVRVDGIPYHVDLFAPQEEGFLKSDESFWGPYRWTTSAYPQCERDYFETDEPETPELQDEPDLTADVLDRAPESDETLNHYAAESDNPEESNKIPENEESTLENIASDSPAEANGEMIGDTDSDVLEATPSLLPN